MWFLIRCCMLNNSSQYSPGYDTCSSFHNSSCIYLLSRRPCMGSNRYIDPPHRISLKFQWIHWWAWGRSSPHKIHLIHCKSKVFCNNQDPLGTFCSMYSSCRWCRLCIIRVCCLVERFCPNHVLLHLHQPCQRKFLKSVTGICSRVQTEELGLLKTGSGWITYWTR